MQAVEKAKQQVQFLEESQDRAEEFLFDGELSILQESFYFLPAVLAESSISAFLSDTAPAPTCARVSDLDDLIMVGGSSRLTVVKRFLTELLGKSFIVTSRWQWEVGSVELRSIIGRR